MVIGFAGGEVPKIPANILLVKNVSAIGFYWGQHALKDNAAYRKSVEDVFKLCDQGKISPHIGKVWTLDQVKYNWTSFYSFIIFYLQILIFFEREKILMYRVFKNLGQD